MAAPATEAGARRPVVSLLLGLTLDRAAEAPPLYRQIQEGVAAEVLGGSLTPGMRLPPERALARALGVNRSTVMQAYQELAASGLVEGRPGRGTVIRTPDPATSQGPGASDLSWLLSLAPFGQGSLGPDPGLLRDLAAMCARPEIISLAAGAPGADLIPVETILAAQEEGIRHLGAGVLTYGQVEGLPALREALAERFVARGMRVQPDEVLVLSGATQGLALAARALIEPGDLVVVEAPTYMGVLQTFAAAGARLLPIPVDERGMRVDMLATLLDRVRPRLIVIQPNLHNPTNGTLSPERRERLLALARKHGVPILEDEAYAELWFEGAGPLPLKAMDCDGNVLYLGTASKTLAPGLRIGWLAAPAPVIARLSLAKQFADLQSNTLAQAGLRQLLVSGEYDRHRQWLCGALAERRAAMLHALQRVEGLRALPGAAGGYYIWCALPAGITSRPLAMAAARAGVAVVAGEAFYPPEGSGSAEGRARIRLSYAGHAPARLAMGVGRLAPLLSEPLEDGRRAGIGSPTMV